MDLRMPTMSEPERVQFSEFIEREYGIKMPPSKKVLLESRLTKRLKVLGMDNYTAYFRYLMSDQGMRSEIFSFVDLISTHKTHFFRDPGHFNFLLNTAFPDIYTEYKRTGKEIKIWSAASSTGEEPYSIAITAEEYKLMKFLPNLQYSILATDLSTEVLQKAFRAVYPEDAISSIPEKLKRKYLMRSKDSCLKQYRISPGLRSKVKFLKVNLMDKVYRVKQKFDIIFCCNVFIYFQRYVQENIIKRMLGYLNKGGYFIVGESESIIGMDVQLTTKAPSIYKKI